MKRLPLALLLIAGCAAPHHRAGVPIDSRPTPPVPDTTRAQTGTPQYGTEDTWSKSTKSTVESRIEADTTAARNALTRCTGKKLLAEQEATAESTERLLADVRRALGAADLSRAESLARQAKQLASSIGCR
jgi:hypothetical protein